MSQFLKDMTDRVWQKGEKKAFQGGKLQYTKAPRQGQEELGQVSTQRPAGSNPKAAGAAAGGESRGRSGHKGLCGEFPFANKW